jgi:uncharacterized protein (DUF2342 family)
MLPSGGNSQGQVRHGSSRRSARVAWLVQTREQRAIMDEVQAAMSVVEGYSEYVMGALGAEVVPGYAGLREAMEHRRRRRSAPERVLEKGQGAR